MRQYHEAQAEGFVLPYGENPFAADRTAERVYLEILNCATRYVHIMTPYWCRIRNCCRPYAMRQSAVWM